MVARAGRYYGAVFKGFFSSDAGRSAFPHHIQCGGGCGGMALDGGDGRGRGRVVRLLTIG